MEKVCCKFIHDITDQIVSESDRLCGRYDVAHFFSESQCIFVHEEISFFSVRFFDSGKTGQISYYHAPIRISYVVASSGSRLHSSGGCVRRFVCSCGIQRKENRPAGQTRTAIIDAQAESRTAPATHNA